MRDEVVAVLIFGAIAIFVVLILLTVNRRSGSIRDLLRQLATAAGWTNLQNLFFVASGVKGMWRQFPVEFGYFARQKGVPARLRLKVVAQADARLIVKRRFEGLLSNRPLAWFGPPIVDVHSPAAAMMWVRGDQALAERMFADQKVASLLASNLVARFDEVKIDQKGLRITRALDERPVRQKYGMPMFSMTFDAQQYAPIAQEEVALAEAVVEKMSLMR